MMNRITLYQLTADSCQLSAGTGLQQLSANSEKRTAKQREALAPRGSI